LLQVRLLPDPPFSSFGILMDKWILNLKDTARNASEFFKEAWQELKKVHWPTQKETYAATVVVIIVVLLLGVFLALVDFGLTRAIQAIVS
jgi:preprotein translocase SecE subunit